MNALCRIALTVACVVLATTRTDAQVPGKSAKNEKPPPAIDPSVRPNPYLYWLIHHQPPPYPYPVPVPVPAYYPAAAGSGYTVINNYYSPVSGSAQDTKQPSALPQTTAMLPPGPATVGVVAINLPTTAAIVWIDGQKLDSGLSATRVYITPQLEAGHTYYYTVKAQWVQRGENTSQQRKVTVAAGKTSVADFTKDDEAK